MQTTQINITQTFYLIGSKEKPLGVIVVCMDIVPDDWWPLQDRGHLFYWLHRDFVRHHFGTWITRGKENRSFVFFCGVQTHELILAQWSLTSPQYVDSRQQLLSHRVQVRGLGHSGSAECSTIIWSYRRRNTGFIIWPRSTAQQTFYRKNCCVLPGAVPGDLTCRTEQEGLGFSQVLVHCISDGHLGMGEGAESLFISRTHLSLYVIEQQREGSAAKLPHLRDKEKSFRFGSPQMFFSSWPHIWK